MLYDTVQQLEERYWMLDDIQRRHTGDRQSPVACRVCYVPYTPVGCVCGRNEWTPISIVCIELRLRLDRTDSNSQ